MIRIRPATPADETALGRYGAALMRQHHVADPRRFILTERPEAGYGRFLVSELADPDVLVLVAEDDSGEVIGYAFSSIERTSWRDLRGPCGFIHDVYVDARARRQGVGRTLVRAAIDWAQGRGRSQIALSSAWGNDTAQRVFESMGFRRTMVEMTLDVLPPASGG